MASKSTAKFIDEVMDDQAEQIDAAIQKIDQRLERLGVQELLDKKQRLVAARRALVGGGLTGGTSDRVRQQDVVDWMEKNPGAHSAQDVAAGLNTNEAVARGHLNRGKDERFIQVSRGRWILRDPEAGVNTADDYEEDEDDA